MTKLRPTSCPRENDETPPKATAAANKILPKATFEALQTAAKQMGVHPRTAAVHSSQGSRGYVPGQPRSIADEVRSRGQAAKAKAKATLRPTAAAASAASILDGIGVPSQAAVTVSRPSGGGTWIRETAALTRTLLFSVPPQTTVPEDFLHNLSDEDLVQCAVELRRAAEERVVERLHRGDGLKSIARMADFRNRMESQCAVELRRAAEEHVEIIASEVTGRLHRDPNNPSGPMIHIDRRGPRQLSRSDPVSAATSSRPTATDAARLEAAFGQAALQDDSLWSRLGNLNYHVFTRPAAFRHVPEAS